MLLIRLLRGFCSVLINLEEPFKGLEINFLQLQLQTCSANFSYQQQKEVDSFLRFFRKLGLYDKNIFPCSIR